MNRYPRSFISLLLVLVITLFFTLTLSVLSLGSPSKALAAPVAGWEVIHLPMPLSHISAVDASTAYAAGGLSLSYTDQENVIIKTTDGGQNWSTVFHSYTTFIYDICAVDASNIWAVTLHNEVIDEYTSVKTFQILRSTNGGSTWELKYSLDGAYIWDYMKYEISAVDPSIAWVAGPGGVVYRTTNGGNTWATLDSGLSPDGVPLASDYSSIYAIDANTAWSAGWSLTWVKSNPGGNPLNLPGPPWAVSLPYFPVITMTTDGGASWTVKKTGTYDTGFSDISAADAGNAIAVGKEIGYDPYPKVMPVAFYPAGGYLYFYTTPISTSGVAITHNGGGDWFPQAVNVPFTLNSAAMVDANTAWVAGDQGVVLKTTNGGVSGVQQAVGTVSYIREIDAVDPATAWAVGFSSSSTTGGSEILRTIDGGDARPDILSVSPASAGWGNSVTIKGIDFGATQDPASFVSFGGVKATDYVSWSDTQIVVKVPAGTSGKVDVVVTTPAGNSNLGSLTVIPGFSITSVTPNWADTGTEVEVAIAGTGFNADAVVSLKSGDTIINPTSTTRVSDTQLTSKFGLTNAAVGTYDVIVSNPGGDSATLAGGFSVTAPSPCGFGSGLGMLMLGISLGLLTLAGSRGMRRKKSE